MPIRPALPSTRTRWLLILLLLIGAGLRLLRLAWQPLWWDEGYSVYFATEPLATMARLTAQDIHPPLYYTLLHLWLGIFGSAAPLVLRTFSVLIGLLSLLALWWLTHILYPSRLRVALWALLLLTISPMHIFYSQEVRMYGLEMLLGLVCTGLFWRLATGDWRLGSGTANAARNKIVWSQVAVWVGYAAATTALVYSEYYAALLPLSHFVWAVWRLRRNRRRLWPLVAAWSAAALAYLPWLFYAIPQLVPYVSQKIVEDADRPLGLLVYALRHLTAFSAGHIAPEGSWLILDRWLAPASILVLFAVQILLSLANRQALATGPRAPVAGRQSFLLQCLLLPFAAGFLLNLRLPFFPAGGERVLLFVLPYFLLLIADAIDVWPRTKLRWVRGLAAVALAGVLAGAGVGVWTFYTVPRYTDDDYRPLIRQSVQQGSDDDTVLAVFPWQVGYWRAYAPVWGRGELHGPWPLLSPAPAWGPDVQAAIDHALERGKLWFPAHLSLGGVLEEQIEDYLRRAAPTGGRVVVNFENRWYSKTTRLSGWARARQPVASEVNVDYAAVQLRTAGLGADTAVAANDVLAVRLGWAQTPTDDLRVSLRLEDEQGRVWAQRDYAPLGSWPPAGDAQTTDQVGFLVPPAVPPGEYRLVVGVGPAQEKWLYPVVGPEGHSNVSPVGGLEIVAPETPLPHLRLPMQLTLAKPVTREGIDFLGVSGFDPTVATLAGAQMNLSLFVQTPFTPSMSWDVYVSLLDGSGAGVAGWEGWPLPAHPLDGWPPGAQMRLPVQFYLPASLSPGTYRLVAGVRNPVNAEKSVPVRLGSLPIVRRAVSFSAPHPQHLLDRPVLFGSHANLLGYDLVIASNGRRQLTLYWRVKQTLLPPHHVFVHVQDGSGALIVQDDGVPGRNQTAAPSNTWIPGEIISDPHALAIPAPVPPGLVAQIGLYEPFSGVRLPVSVDGQVTGDSYDIPLDSP